MLTKAVAREGVDTGEGLLGRAYWGGATEEGLLGRSYEDYREGWKVGVLGVGYKGEGSEGGREGGMS